MYRMIYSSVYLYNLPEIIIAFLALLQHFTYFILNLNCIQCLCNVCNQIIFIFQSAGNTDQSRRNTGCDELFVCHLPVCGGCRIQATGTCICYVCLDCCQLQVFHKFLCCFSSAFQFKSNNAASAVWQIFFCDFIVLVRWKCRIVDKFYFIMLFQKFCNCLSIFHMSWHTHMQRFQTKI